MSCSRLDHLTTIRAGARTVTFCELMKKEKAEREREAERKREREGGVTCWLIFSFETHCWFLTVTLAEAKQRGVKGRAKKINVERDRSIEREKE